MLLKLNFVEFEFQDLCKYSQVVLTLHDYICDLVVQCHTDRNAVYNGLTLAIHLNESKPRLVVIRSVHNHLTCICLNRITVLCMLECFSMQGSFQETSQNPSNGSRRQSCIERY